MWDLLPILVGWRPTSLEVLRVITILGLGKELSGRGQIINSLSPKKIFQRR